MSKILHPNAARRKAAERQSEDERPPFGRGTVHLASRDPKRAGRFYAQLGFRTVGLMDSLAILEMRGGTHLEIRLDPGAVGAPADWDLMVEDLDATRDAWLAQEVPVTEIGKDEREIHRIFTVTDPDGNTVIVHDSHVVGIV
jgi:catechol 2,3-dioxygenase-like lactoylglutathione lyase family enzyme